MAKQTILTGSTANDHSGDPLRTAFTKVNANFTELYASTVGGSTGNFTFLNDAISNPAGMVIETGRGNLAIGTDMEVPGVPTHFHIAFQNGNTEITNGQLFLGDDFNYVNVGSYNGVNIGSFNRYSTEPVPYLWNFNVNGDLSLPIGGDILDSNGVSVLNVYTPTTPADWTSPAPITISEAIDRLAAAFKVANTTGA
jgi:hypothetical protein